MAWLESQRWFADKGRRIVNVAVADLLLERVDEGLVALCVARLEFADGQATYLLPFGIVSDEEGAARILDRSVDSGDFVIDATETTWLGRWLGDVLSGARRVGGSSWQFTSTETGAALLEAARSGPCQAFGAEQSNTSINLGSQVIVKLSRRLQKGPSPEVEVLRALDAQRFPHVPAFVGEARWRDSDGAEHPIALAQAFVPNVGDGWRWTLRRLEAIGVGNSATLSDRSPEWLLGKRTAELHLALSTSRMPDFQPVAATDDWAVENAGRTRERIEPIVALLHERASRLPHALKLQLPEISAGIRALVPLTDGFRGEAGTLRVRVHGDYHLGQVLRTPDDDWTIIDFEGEPARPVLERRQATSVLKDVAGMLRSFSYARGVAQRTLTDASQVARDRLASWESTARADFLAGYRATLPTASGLAPTGEAAFLKAVRAWELDKALYEIAYEARNRPEWLSIPLRSILPQLFESIDDSAGGAPT